MRLSIRVASLFLLFAPPGAVSAQVGVESNVLVASAYVWRGVTTTNRVVVQPDATLTIPIRGQRLTLGGWASIEPARYDGAADISVVSGLLPGPALTEFSAWIEHETALGDVGITTGINASLYPAVANLATWNTVELTAAMHLPLPLSPSLAVAYDVGAIRGAYVEGTIGIDRELVATPVTLSVTGGVNLGQGPDANALGYFNGRGLTHLEFAATVSRDVGAFTIAPTLHVIRGIDRATQVTSPTATRTLKLWLGATISWTAQRGRRG